MFSFVIRIHGLLRVTLIIALNFMTPVTILAALTNTYACMQGELLRALGGVRASASLLGVPLGHNSSFLQGPAFAPPRIREAIWCGSTNSSTEEGKHNIIKMFSSSRCM